MTPHRSPSSPAPADKRDFAIVVRCEAGQDAAAQLRSLRHLLKRMARNHGLQCRSIKPIDPDPEAESPPQPQAT